MARPPFARRAPHTAGEPPAGGSTLDVLPHAYADFLAMERELASTELGFPVVDEASAKGDLAGTVMEMSALVAHVLALYSDRYGNEVFLGTASSPSSLVRHGRRLAYEPGPGVTASGYLALFAKEDLAGTIPARFAFSSAPVGEKPAQDYELIEPVPIEASLNAILPVDIVEPIVPPVGSTISLQTLTLAGIGFALEIGERVVVGWKQASTWVFRAAQIAGVELDSDLEETKVSLSSAIAVDLGADVTLFAHPALEAQAFGHDAPEPFFLSTFVNAIVNASLTNVRGYLAPNPLLTNGIFLDRIVDAPLVDEPLLRVSTSATALRVVTQRNVAAKLLHRTPDATTVTDSSGSPTIVQTTYTMFPSTTYQRTVSEVTTIDETGAAFTRPAALDRLSMYLGDWQVRAAVRVWQPSTAAVTTPLVLEGAHPSLLPGHLFALEPIGSDAGLPSRIARVVSSTMSADQTSVSFELVEPGATLVGLRRGYVRVLGNIGRITHGKTVTEVLGDSDGVSPFQRLRLAKTPVAHVLTEVGAEPQLELRVGGALFHRVIDYEDAAPTDAVYLTERDDTGVVSVVFGDGAKGAIPPSGKRHVQAIYRKGIGRLGNAPALAVAKIAKAHPLLERVYNPVPVAGGVEPASPDDVRAEAPLYLATFDRAVSVADHAKLALLCPGVVRARAFVGEVSPGVEGVLVVIADRDGAAPNAAAVARFLRERRDNTLPCLVVPPRIIDVSLHLAVVFDASFDAEAVKLALRALLASTTDDAPGLLTFAKRDLGQPLFMSQVVEWVERLPGIVRFAVSELAVASGGANPVGVPPATLDTVRAEPDEWIRLLSQNLVIDTLTESA